MFIFMQRIHMKINQYLINKREEVRLDHFNDTKTFIEYSNDIRDG